MLILILGHPDSGKSEKAEDWVLSHADPENRVYLATMIVQDEEGRKRVQRHRERRKGKSFRTIESTQNVTEALRRIPEAENKTVLLECLSNLVANEHFAQKQARVPEKICRDLKVLEEATAALVVVSNTFEMQESFDEETEQYIMLVHQTNEMVRAMADEVIEVE